MLNTRKHSELGPKLDIFAIQKYSSSFYAGDGVVQSCMARSERAKQDMNSKRQNLRLRFRIQLTKCGVPPSPLSLSEILGEEQSRVFFLLHREPLQLQHQRLNSLPVTARNEIELGKSQNWSIVRPWLSTAVRNTIRNSGAIIGHDLRVVEMEQTVY